LRGDHQDDDTVMS